MHTFSPSPAVRGDFSVTARLDGRHARSKRTRGHLVGATRALMLEGALRPTAQMVAMTAQVSLRSVFQHYPTMNDLYREALDEATLAALVQWVSALGASGAVHVIVFGERP